MSLAVLWTQQYIVESVQINQNFDLYLYAQIGLGAFVLVFLLPIPFLRIFKIDPTWLQKLDQIRIDAQQVTKTDEVKPRRVSVAIDFHSLTTTETLFSRRQTMVEPDLSDIKYS